MKFALFISTYLFCLLAHAQDYKALISLANDNYTKKEYSRSVELYQQAFKLTQNSRSDLYNGACSAALSNNPDLALKWLNLAFDHDYINIRHMKTDTDLTSLHATEGWKILLSKMQKKVDQIEANYDKPLQNKLLTIFDEDQKYRMQVGEVGQKYGFESKEIKALWKTMEEKDSLNLLEVKAILDQYGWVGEDKVGSQANSTLFLVIQHADLPTQQKYLPMMRQAVKAGKAQSSALALLEDRVALGEKRRQTYGSQIGEDSTGTSYVLPLDDPDNVDKRRAAVGLGPLADYVKRWGVTWSVADYKKQLPELEKREGIK
jgi:tetratricopeptide (TPR) repeat protein